MKINGLRVKVTCELTLDGARSADVAINGFDGREVVAMELDSAELSEREFRSLIEDASRACQDGMVKKVKKARRHRRRKPAPELEKQTKQPAPELEEDYYLI